MKLRTEFHPQTDGQSEIVNKTISMYLRCMTGDRPRAWLDWLPWAEFCYNSSYHSALKATPFHVVYGRTPPSIPPYQVGTAQTENVDTMLADRDEFLREVRTRLTQAQDYARRYYDTHHRELEFTQGNWAWLRLLNRPTIPWFQDHDQIVAQVCRTLSDQGTQWYSGLSPGLAGTCTHP